MGLHHIVQTVAKARIARVESMIKQIQKFGYQGKRKDKRAACIKDSRKKDPKSKKTR